MAPIDTCTAPSCAGATAWRLADANAGKAAADVIGCGAGSAMIRSATIVLPAVVAPASGDVAVDTRGVRGVSCGSAGPWIGPEATQCIAAWTILSGVTAG